MLILCLHVLKWFSLATTHHHYNVPFSRSSEILCNEVSLLFSLDCGAHCGNLPMRGYWQTQVEG